MADVDASSRAATRGGAQSIPRPVNWRPGAPAPWSGVRIDDSLLTIDAVSDALDRRARDRAPRPSALENTGIRGSAVLAPLYVEGDEVSVVLTRRAQHLRLHRGEVSFPGGGQDPGETMLETALREAREETGMDPSAVHILGELDHLDTAMNRSYIVPFVGVLPDRPALVANDEVELILHVPLRELLGDGVYHEERWGLPPDDRPLRFFEIVGDTIWGATAAMLRDLLVLTTGTGER